MDFASFATLTSRRLRREPCDLASSLCESAAAVQPTHQIKKRPPKGDLFFISGRQDLNLRPLRPERSDRDLQDELEQEVTSSETTACTNACTKELENDNETALQALAKMLLTLPPEKRAKLAELLCQADTKA